MNRMKIKTVSMLVIGVLIGGITIVGLYEGSKVWNGFVDEFCSSR